MKFGFDIHGVIDSLPKVFSFLTKSIIASGGEVHILTGGAWSEKIEKQLKDLDIVWTHHFSVYDIHIYIVLFYSISFLHNSYGFYFIC